MTNSKHFSRRRFLAATGAAVGAVAVSRWDLAVGHASTVITPHGDIAALRRDIVGSKERGQLLFMFEYSINQTLQAVLVVRCYVLTLSQLPTGVAQHVRVVAIDTHEWWTRLQYLFVLRRRQIGCRQYD